MLPYLVSLAYLRYIKCGEKVGSTLWSYFTEKKGILWYEIPQLLALIPPGNLCIFFLTSSVWLILVNYCLTCTSVLFHQLLTTLRLGPGCSVFTLSGIFFITLVDTHICPRKHQTLQSILLDLLPILHILIGTQDLKFYLLSNHCQWMLGAFLVSEYNKLL